MSDSNEVVKPAPSTATSESLVGRLRFHVRNLGENLPTVMADMEEAADEIERLRAAMSDEESLTNALREHSPRRQIMSDLLAQIVENHRELCQEYVRLVDNGEFGYPARHQARQFVIQATTDLAGLIARCHADDTKADYAPEGNEEP